MSTEEEGVIVPPAPVKAAVDPEPVNPVPVPAKRRFEWQRYRTSFIVVLASSLVALLIGARLRENSNGGDDPALAHQRMPGSAQWVQVYEAIRKARPDAVENSNPDVDDDDPGTRQISLLYCHALGAPLAPNFSRTVAGPQRHEDWLMDQRAEHRENETLPKWAKEWAETRCLASPLHAFESQNFSRYQPDLATVIPAILGRYTPATLNEHWAPRVSRVLVDARGDIYLRLVLVDATQPEGLSQRLVLLRSLLQTLDAYRRVVHERLAPFGVKREPCLCPLHFGIVGSGSDSWLFCRCPPPIDVHPVFP